MPSWPWSQQQALESDPTAESVLRQGLDMMERKKYTRAIYFFEKVRDEFPFSSQVLVAELKIAEAHYLNKEFPEAIQGFKEFLAMHPTHEKAPFVIYHLALAHFDQFSGIDRDLKNINLAKDYFKTVIKKYPASPYAAKAKEKVGRCREYLAEREMYVASFYIENKKYPAARQRLEDILRRYRDTPTAVKALFQLAESYRLQKNTVKAALAFKALIQHYPEDPLASKARVQLSQLSEKKDDPLAMLLIDDGRPVFIPPPPVEGVRPKKLNLVAKKEVVHEEPGATKGAFRRIIDTINPFASSEDSGEKEAAKEKVEKGKEKSRGFFASLWPFGGKEDGNPKSREGANPRLVSKIDESLKKKGIDQRAREITSTPPETDLPQVGEEPPPDPAETAKVLGQIDQSLKKEGKDGEELPAPQISSRLFEASASRARKKRSGARRADSHAETRASSSTAKLLATIDKGLKKKAITPPSVQFVPFSDLKRDETTPQKTAHKKPQEQIELTPTLAPEKKSPLLDDIREYTLQERPDTGEKNTAPGDAEVTEQASTSKEQPDKELPATLLKGAGTYPIQNRADEKQAAGQSPAGNKNKKEESKSVLEEIGDQYKSIGDLLNPFGQ